MPETQTQSAQFDFDFCIFTRPEDRTDLEIKARVWSRVMSQALEDFMSHWSPEAVLTLAMLLDHLQDHLVSEQKLNAAEKPGARELLELLHAEIERIQPAKVAATPTAPPPITLIPRNVQ